MISMYLQLRSVLDGGNSPYTIALFYRAMAGVAIQFGKFANFAVSIAVLYEEWWQKIA